VACTGLSPLACIAEPCALYYIGLVWSLAGGPPDGRGEPQPRGGPETLYMYWSPLLVMGNWFVRLVGGKEDLQREVVFV